MPNSEWQQKTYTYEFLRQYARTTTKNISMVAWLKMIGVIPLITDWRRGNRLPNLNLNPEAMPAGYLAEVARDWDAEGYTTPDEFLDALAFEIRGSRQKQVVMEVLDGLVVA